MNKKVSTMPRLVKYLLIFVVVILAATAAAIGGAYWYVTNNDVKDILASAVKRTTGHDLFIMGEAKLTIFPQPTLMATDIRIPAFNGDTPIFTAQKIDLAAKWGTPPFIWKGVALNTLTAEAPTIFLKENKKGLPNWESPVRGKEGFGGASSGGGTSAINSIGTIALNNVTFTYEGDKSGTNVNVKNLNLNVNGEDLANTLINATGTVNGTALTANGSINMKSKERPTNVTLSAAGATLNFSGNTNTSTPSGQVTLSGNNLRKTLAQFVEPAAVSSLPAQNFTLSTALQPDGSTTTLKNLKVELGNALNFSGEATHKDRGRSSPLITVNGSFNTLNLDALKLCGQTSSNTPTTEWDNTPIDLSFIRTANWEAQLAINSLTCQDVPITNLTLNTTNDGLTVNIKNLTAKLPKNGSLNVTGTVKYGTRILADLNIKPQNLPIEAFLTTPGDLVFPLSGNLDLNLEGASMKSLMESINGNATLTARNVILPARRLEAISLKLSAIMGGARTATADFNAALAINKGVADVTTMQLQTKDGFLTIAGSGKIDIGHRSMALKITPNAKTNGGIFKGGVAIPVTVQGRWHDIKVRPDATITKGVATGIGAAVGGPAGALIGNTVGSVLSGDKNAVGNLIQGVTNLGKPTSPTEETTTPATKNSEDQVKDAVQGLIKGLF